METREWILKRNCSIAPRRLAWVTAIFCAVLPTNRSAFIVQGAWTIQIVTVAKRAASGVAAACTPSVGPLV
jgi:uncharacterized membrane protein